VDIPFTTELDPGGVYQWRRNGEQHAFNPLTIAHLQNAVRSDQHASYDEYARLINEQQLFTLRGLMDFVPSGKPVPIEEVEPWTEIVKRFKTGAMSYGSISEETHEALAVAMTGSTARATPAKAERTPRDTTVRVRSGVGSSRSRPVDSE
jgi:glutamate synthase (NADPH) large chain